MDAGPESICHPPYFPPTTPNTVLYKFYTKKRLRKTVITTHFYSVTSLLLNPRHITPWDKLYSLYAFSHHVLWLGARCKEYICLGHSSFSYREYILLLKDVSLGYMSSRQSRYTSLHTVFGWVFSVITCNYIFMLLTRNNLFS